MNNTDFQKLTTLLSAWSDKRISDQQIAELDELLQQSEEARELYLEFVSMDIGLQDSLRSLPKHLLDKVVDSAIHPTDSVDEELVRSKDSTLGGEPTSGRSLHMGFFIGAITASLALAFLPGRLAKEQRDPAPAQSVAESTAEDLQGFELAEPNRLAFGYTDLATMPSVAMLASTLNAEWDGDAPKEGAALYSGTLKLNQGIASIDFYCGATAILEGPAEVELQSQSSIRCLTGKIRVRVPEPAQGFVVESPDGRVIDLGTEFTMKVLDNEATEVHVVEGEVDVASSLDLDSKSDSTLLTEGQSVRFSERSGTGSIFNEPIDVVTHHELESILRSRHTETNLRWQEFREKWANDPDTVMYYDFEPIEGEDRRLRNRALNSPSDRRATDGIIIGAEWSEGRFPGKSALDFRRISDQVRLVIPGTYDQITMSVWLRCDAFDRKYTSILLTDRWNLGEPHWQFGKADPSLGIRHSDYGNKDMVQFSVNAMTPNVRYWSKLDTSDVLCHWTHLAVTYDSTKGEVAQYVNGQLQELSLTLIDLEYNSTTVPIQFGQTQLANWFPSTGDLFVCRSFRGKMDEFLIVGRSMSELEVADLFEASKP